MLLSLIAVVVVWVASPFAFGPDTARARGATERLRAQAPVRPTDAELRALVESLVERDRLVLWVVTAVFVAAVALAAVPGQLFGIATFGDVTTLFLLLVAYAVVAAVWSRRALRPDDPAAPRVARSTATDVADYVGAWERRSPLVMTVIATLLCVAAPIVAAATGHGGAHLVLVNTPALVVLGTVAFVCTHAARRTVEAPQPATSRFGLYGQDLIRSTAVRAPYWVWMLVACGACALAGFTFGLSAGDRAFGIITILVMTVSTLVLAIAYVSAAASRAAEGRFRERLWAGETVRAG